MKRFFILMSAIISGAVSLSILGIHGAEAALSSN